MCRYIYIYVYINTHTHTQHTWRRDREERGVPREMGAVEKELTPPYEGFPPVNLGVDVCAGIDEVEDFGVG